MLICHQRGALRYSPWLLRISLHALSLTRKDVRAASSTVRSPPPDTREHPHIDSTGSSLIRKVDHRNDTRDKELPKDIHEEEAALSINTLGRKSRIIILRRAGFTGDEARDIVSKVPDARNFKGLSKAEILDMIKEEKVTPQQGDVNKAIDSYRPVATGEAQCLTQGEYDKLYRQLFESFTGPQLRQYLGTEPYANKRDHEIQRILQTWSPGTTPIETKLSPKTWRDRANETNKRLKLVDAGAGPSSRFARKGGVIDHIIRGYWGCDVGSIGQVEMTVETWQLDLLYTACTL
jgi:hypothetical protein